MKNRILRTPLAKGQVGIFYLGQEGMLIKYNEKYLMIDAYLSDYVDQNCCDYVQWIRKYEAPIKPEELDFVDYVLCTHDHYDHMDPYTLRAVATVNSKAVFIAPKPVACKFTDYGVSKDRILTAVCDQVITADGFSITPIPSAHEELHTDENGDYIEMGYLVNAGDACIYHAGDCCLYEGLEARVAHVDVMMVPINGRSYFKRYEEDIIGNMTAEEAVLLAKKANASLLVPMHFDLYEVNGVNPAHFVDTLYTLNPSQRFHIFAPGESYILTK